MSEERLPDLVDILCDDAFEYLETLDFSPPNFIRDDADERFFVSGRGQNHDSESASNVEDTADNNNRNISDPIPSTSGYNPRHQSRTRQHPNDDSDSDISDGLDEFIYDEEDILSHHIKKLEQNNGEFNQNRQAPEDVTEDESNLLNNSEVREVVAKFKYLKVLSFRHEARFRRVLQKDFCRMKLINIASAKAFALAMNELCMLIRAAYNENDFIGIRIKLTDNINDDGIFITLRHPSQYSVALILNNFTRIAQSAREYYGTDNIEIFIDCIHTLSGGRRINLNRPTLDLISEMIRKNSIVVSDLFKSTASKINDCLFIVIAIGILMNNSRPPPQGYRVKIIDGNFLSSSSCNNVKQFSRLIDNEVAFLLQSININRDTFSGDNYPDMEEIQKIQNLLKNYRFSGNPLERAKAKEFAYRIIIFDLNGNNLFVGDLTGVNLPIKNLNLLLVNQHYHYISSITACFSKSYYCKKCHKVYNNFTSHRNCPFRCEKCLENKPCKSDYDGLMKPCKDCNRSFHGLRCFNKHKKNNICSKIRFCPTCNGFIRKRHECFKFYCIPCEDLKEPNHVCMIPLYKPPDFNLKKEILIFYDIETRMVSNDDNRTGSKEFNHEPYLIVSQNACELCKSIENSDNECRGCGVREHIFFTSETDDCVYDFLNYLIAMSEGSRITAVGHNAASFDLVLLSRKIFNSKISKPPKIILKGLKIILLEWGPIRFVDSLAFLCTSLKNLPKMLGLNASHAKGYFPYRFFEIKNTGYVGKIPDKKFFDCWNMKPEDLHNFETWYAEASQHEYNLLQNLVVYCKNDTSLLRLSVLKFIQECIEDSGLNPLLVSITLASYTNKIFRYKYYEQNISITPPVAYRLTQNQSEIAIKYLFYMSRKLQLDIQSAYNGKEKIVRVGNKSYLVDGYAVDEKTGNEIVFEFSGCIFHGHTASECLLGSNFLRSNSSSFLPNQAIRAEKTDQKLRDLKTKFKVYHIYECQFRKLMADEPQIAMLLKQINLDHIKIRDVLKGGWCETIRPLYEVQDSEKIAYVDYVSLYPWIVASKPLPIFGHVKIYIGDECMSLDLQAIDGIIKCNVLPPTDILFPILPVKLTDRLMFPLCFTCASEQSKNFCNHSDDERIISGTWTINEIRVALEQGYQILNIMEIVQFRMKAGLFKKFIDNYFTLKLYNSGYPTGYNKDNINEFIQQYYQKHSIYLDADKFTDNPSKRSLCKLILNSAWGKLCEKTRLKSSIIKESSDLMDMIYDKSKNIKSMVILNEHTLLTSHEDNEAKAINTTNVVLAAYVTAYGRIQTIQLAEKLGAAVTYADTDGLKYIQRNGNEKTIILGNDLGSISNELEKYGKEAYIRKFVSTGCKSYCAEIFDPESEKIYSILKIKGVTLNVANTSTINFNKMREMVEIPEGLEDSANSTATARDIAFKRKIDGTITTHERKKTFKMTLSKRFRVKNLTFPYGFSQAIAEEIIQSEAQQ